MNIKAYSLRCISQAKELLEKCVVLRIEVGNYLSIGQVLGVK